jgi:hypothetical protein
VPRGKLVGVLVVPLLAAAIASCGDGARAAFIADADAVCKRAHERHPRVKVDTQADAVRATGAAVSRHTEEERGLDRLKPPAELQTEFDAFKKDTQQMQQLAVAGKAAAEEGDPDLYNQALKDYTTTQNERRAVAQQIGFKQCGKRLSS